MLVDSLADGSIKLSHAHLVVVSDAQRVVPMVTPHPVLRLMSDFHSKTPAAPRVFATLQSSIDRWASLDLTRLETPLQARSFFVAPTRNLQGDIWSGPMELVVEYEPYCPTQTEPDVSAAVRKSDPQGTLFRAHHYRRACRVFLQLGPYAAYLYWKSVMTTSLSKGGLSESTIATGLENLESEKLGDKLDIDVSSRTCNATPKLAKCVQMLELCERYGAAFRGVVYVQDRSVARVLSDLLGTQLSFLRPAVLCGSSWRGVKSGNETLKSFEAGIHNLLVSTKSCEDMDIAPAGMIIHFDLFEDQLSYAYSQAHSKGRQSHLIYMVARENNEHRRIVTRLQTSDDAVRGWIADLAQGQEGTPPRTIYTSFDPYTSDGEDEDEEVEYILDPTTSARIHKSGAVAAVYRFIAEVYPISGVDDGTVSLILEEQPGEHGEATYHYTLSFPVSTRLPTIVGPRCASRWEARREACYQACKELVRVGLMNVRHFPQSGSAGSFASKAPNRQKAKTTASAFGYPRKTPDFWPNSQSGPPTVLYPTVVVPENLGDEPHAPVLFLTRAPLPLIPEFTVFFSGAGATVHFYKGEPIEVTDVQLKALHEYTLRVSKTLMNKPLECPVGNMLCYFAPLDSTWHSSLSAHWPLLSLGEHIPWDAVQLAADYFAIPLVDGIASLDERAQDAIVLDRQVEYTSRYFLVKVRHDLTPLSKAEDSPREAEYPNFLEYCKARIKDFQGLDDENQHMIEVKVIPAPVNNLHPTSGPPTPPGRPPLKYLIPELCYKFTIPASTFRTLWLMPSIMEKMNMYLLTKELNAKLFRNAILEQQLHIALSTPALWTEFDYERLEFLGDSFLKVVASNFLFATMPGADVGALHTARGPIISNKSLQQGAARIGLPSYIQHKRFVAKLWQVPLASDMPPSATKREDGDGDVEMAEAEQEPKDKGKRSKKQRQADDLYTIWLGDKTIADVVEAILAASFLSGGHEVALQTARVMQVNVPNVAQWADYARLAAEHGTSGQNAGSPPTPATLEAVERLFGSHFRKPELVGQALSHTAKVDHKDVKGKSYDTLEFLGDAVLDFLVARWVWERYPYLGPGGMSLLKSAMVSNETLAAFCVHIGLHQYLQGTANDLSSSIQKYVDFMEELRKKEYDLATRENRLPGQYWIELPLAAPKCLADVVESMLGALYVSDDFFEAGVGNFFENVYKPFIEAHIRLQTLSGNPKTTLLEFLQAEGCVNNAVVKRPAEKQNQLVHMEVVVHGQVIASVVDASNAVSTRKATLGALDFLANHPDFLSRTCNCKTAAADQKKTPAKKEKEPAEKPASKKEEDEASEAEVEDLMDAVNEE
ncbi:hypothetical protein L226DRAFT_463450 [Lentinus tigrinus ALCF2SS1-7]|uniref:Uncharacterized protein n=1 Tax=Lentinus tigrinus ALCF2SS1-6 TaxID=1328759 RepID=A0A5C2SFJ0_9APHY|nr:hypothetical protein L227DRAFT_499178 [Lentinus tigrinus ALCF2SS1-6]RPD74462.1 hypothetical protein L226DRAFT_463450 [Lentinus tigrinus ALCF2SS1-7]